MLALLVAAAAAQCHAAPAAQASIWPQPRSLKAVDGEPIRFAAFNFTSATDSPDGLLSKAFERYRGIILADNGGAARFSAPGEAAAPYTITFEVADTKVPLSPGPDMDESYSLDAGRTGCTVAAPTSWGALKALETLSQLISPGERPAIFYESRAILFSHLAHCRLYRARVPAAPSEAAGSGGDGAFEMPVLTVHDAPRFSWRGLMIDTGRNYLTVTTIKMCLDAMAYTKLNILHWHMVDDQVRRRRRGPSACRDLC